MLRLLHSLDKLFLLHTSLALHTSIRQNLLELFDPQFGNILLLHFFRFDGELDGTNFGVGLVDALTNFERGHTERKGVGNVSLDGVNVVANFLFACR